MAFALAAQLAVGLTTDTQHTGAFANAIARAVDLPPWWSRDPPTPPHITGDMVAWSARFNGSRARSNRMAVEATDHEAEAALSSLLCGYEGGLLLEVGGLDGVRHSETLEMARVMRARRVIMDGNPDWRKERRARAPDVVGVEAAVCAKPRVVHYVRKDLVSGILEFMPPPFLDTFHHEVARALKTNGGRWGPRVFRAAHNPVVRVPCLRLGDIFSHFNISHLAFAIIDLEGGELSALRGLDLRAVRVDVLVVEATPQERPRGYRERVVDQVRRASGDAYVVAHPELGRNVWLRHRDFEPRRCAEGGAPVPNLATPFTAAARRA